MALLTLVLAVGASPVAAQGTAQATVSGGHALPGVSAHPDAVKVASTTTAHFACQDRHIDDPSAKPACYNPQSIQTAYGVSGLLSHGITGAGRTIVIIDAFGNPYITSDLSIFDQTFGLPDPTLNVIYPNGQTPFDITNGDQISWSGEISLDVEWAHAIAPGAKIDLVLAKSDADSDINNALAYAVTHNLGDVISQSFGEAESCVAPKDLRYEHQLYELATARNMTLLASSGDDGAALPSCDGTTLIKSASSPASDPLVTGVGGTNLSANTTTGAYLSERAWSDAFSGCFPTTVAGCSGGGFSTIYNRPFYQWNVPGIPSRQRGVPDVSYNAGVDGGVLGHWGVGNVLNGIAATDPATFFIFGGTSAGSPQWAGIIALADQFGHGRVGFVNDQLYAAADSRFAYGALFHDVTTGNNSLAPIVGYNAGRGWDPVTGLGTPNAATLVPYLALRNDHDRRR